MRAQSTISSEAMLERAFESVEAAAKQVEKIYDQLLALANVTCKDLEKISSSLGEFFRSLEEEKNHLIVRTYGMSEDLLRRMKHNLCSHMAAVQNYSELIFEESTPEQRTEREGVNQLARAAADVLALIDEIQTGDYASVESNIVALEETFSLYSAQYEACSALVVDDSPYNREILDRRLKKYGLTVYQAENGKQALHKAQEHSIDLILLDIFMPGFNGYQVLEGLKDNPRTKDIPVLMLSTVHDVNAIVRCIQAGAADYLAIPFNPTILNARIRACLDRKRLQDQQTRNDKELNKLKTTLQAVVEGVDQGLAVMNREGFIKTYNKAFAQWCPAVTQNEVSRFGELLQHMANQLPDIIARTPEFMDLASSNIPRPGAYRIPVSDTAWLELHISETPGGYLAARVVPTSAECRIS